MKDACAAPFAVTVNVPPVVIPSMEHRCRNWLLGVCFPLDVVGYYPATTYA